LACGIPAIASNAGGLPEVVRHEKSGFLITPGNVSTLAKYMLCLIEENEDL